MGQGPEIRHISLPFKGKESDFEIAGTRAVSLGEGRTPRTIFVLAETGSNPPAFRMPDRDIVQIARLIAEPPGEKLALHTGNEKASLIRDYAPRVRAGVAFIESQGISIAYNRKDRSVYILPGDARPPVLTTVKKVGIGLVGLAVATGIGLNVVMDESNGQNGPVVPKYSYKDLFKKVPPAPARVAPSATKSQTPEASDEPQPAPPRPVDDVAPGIFVNPATGDEHGSRPAALKDARMDCAAATVDGVGNMALLSPHVQVQTDPKSKGTKPLIGMPYKDVETLFKDNAPVVIKDPDSGALKSGYVAYIPSLERMEAFLSGLKLGPKDIKWGQATTNPDSVAAAQKFMTMLTCGEQIVDSRIVDNTEKPGQEKGGVYLPGYALTDISLATSTPYEKKVIRSAELQDNLDQQVHVRVVLRNVTDEKTGEVKPSLWIGHTAAPEKYEDHLTDSYLKKALKVAREDGNFSADHGKGAIEAPRPVATAIMVSRPPQSKPDHPDYGTTTVPEPGSLSLFAFGLAALGGAAFRRRSQSKPESASTDPKGPDLTL